MRLDFATRIPIKSLVMVLFTLLLADCIFPPEFYAPSLEWFLPLDTGNRRNWSTAHITNSARFKARRRTAQNGGARFHTGIDFQNGGNNGRRGGPGEPVYAMANGIVFGIFGKLPNKRVVLMHRLGNGRAIWSSYLHIAEPRVVGNEYVTPNTVIARRMNQAELNRYGQHFNHVHVEILRRLPPRFYGQYQWMSQYCYTEEQVDRYFYNPQIFLQKMWSFEEVD